MASPRHVRHDTVTGVVEFVERPEVARTLYTKRPAYFDRMTPMDLRARGYYMGQCQDASYFFTYETLAATRAAYMQAYVNAVVPFTPHEKTVLDALVEAADLVLANYRNISRLPWRFAKLKDHIEHGYPHTHADVIFLHESFFSQSRRLSREMLKTIVHEKVHVYQRQYPAQTSYLIRGLWHYRPHDDVKNYADARNNPDVDGIVYAPGDKCGQAGFYMAYRNHGAPDLADAVVRTTTATNKAEPAGEAYEHPFERMAYQLGDIIVDQKLMDNSTGLLMRWAIDHL